MKIYVNLMKYFFDHRQLVKVYIKETFSTIRDLENHIAKTFNLKAEFYLKVENHYFLPSDEDVRILNDEDYVFVVPLMETNTHENKNNAICDKNASQQNGVDIAQKCDEIINADENYNKTKKKKKIVKFTQQLSTDTSDVNTEHEIYSEPAWEPVNNENNVCDANKSDSTNAVVEKNDQMSVSDKLKVNDKINLRKRRRCISTSKDDAPNCSSVIAKNDCDKEEKSVEDNIETPMEQSNSSIVQKIEVVNLNPKELISSEGDETKNNTLAMNDIVDFLKKSRASTDTPNKTDDQDSSINSSQKSNDISATADDVNKSSSTNINSPQRMGKHKILRTYSGVGQLLTELSSDAGENTDAGGTFVTKRKRIRTRRRKTDSFDVEEENSNNQETHVFVPPKTQAAPKSHIKFETNVEEENIAHSSPVPKRIVLRRDSANKNKNRAKLSVIDCNPENLPPMKELPEVGSKIVFKMFKMDQNYCPIITNYIFAEVQQIYKLTKAIRVKVLEGIDQLKEPNGKFSMISDEDLEKNVYPNNVVILKKDKLIDPKIVCNK